MIFSPAISYIHDHFCISLQIWSDLTSHRSRQTTQRNILIQSQLEFNNMSHITAQQLNIIIQQLSSIHITECIPDRQTYNMFIYALRSGKQEEMITPETTTSTGYDITTTTTK